MSLSGYNDLLGGQNIVWCHKVDVFLALLEKLTQLASLVHERRRETFNEIIEPLFRGLEPVIDDYFLMFQEARDAIESTSPERMSEAVGLLRARRERLLQDRVRVRSSVQAIAEYLKDRKFQSFASSVTAFFWGESSSLVGDSEATRLIRVFENLDVDPIASEELVSRIDDILRNLEQNWGDIASQYARLRVEYLLPQRWGSRFD